jgi:hypothetical protein
MAVLIGQLYVLVRSWVKLVFWASETALFQSRLAHAGYVAAVKQVTEDNLKAGYILKADADATIAEAEKAEVGKK